MSDVQPTRAQIAKTWRLVGKFMWHWAGLEQQLNRGLHKLLRLRGVEAYIVTANISLRDKLSAIRTHVHWICGETEWWKKSDKALARIGTLNNEKRNIAAHNPFLPHQPSGGVEFVTIRAKQKFAVPDVVWTPADFSSLAEEIDALSDQVKAIVDHACTVRALTQAAAPPLAANIFALQPSGVADLPAGVLQALPHPPGSPDAPQSSPEGATPKPKAPRSKAKG